MAGQVELILGDVDNLETRQKWPEALAALRRAAAVVAGGDADEATAERVRQGLKAVELSPTIGDAHKDLYELLRDQGKLDEAIAVFRKAIEIDPKSADAQDNLGLALRNDLKDYDKAAECFRKAIELNPKNAKYWVHLSFALQDQRKLDEVQRCLPQGHRNRSELERCRRRLFQARQSPGGPAKAGRSHRLLPESRRTRPELFPCPQLPGLAADELLGREAPRCFGRLGGGPKGGRGGATIINSVASAGMGPLSRRALESKR